MKKRRLNREGVVREPEKLDEACQEEAIALQGSWGRGKEAFEAIVNRYMKKAYFIALGLVGNREDALELSQEAFFRAYCNISRLKEGGKFFPWFYQILRNLCFSHLRKRRGRRTYSLEGVEGDKLATGSGDFYDAEAVAERNEVKEQVWKAIGRLGDKHREVIILRHFQELSYEQISENLFCSKGTVMSRLYHARKKLKEVLDTEKGGRQE